MSDPEIEAFLLAGGRGLRLRPLTERTSKPMRPFLGSHPRRMATRAGVHPDPKRHVLAVGDAGPFRTLAVSGRRLGLQVVSTPSANRSARVGPYEPLRPTG